MKLKKNEVVVYDGFHQIIQFETEVKGKTVKRELLVAKSAVAGIVIDEHSRIGLVKQYRPVVQRYTKEIPAGVLDKEGLTPMEVLIEELMEECEIPKEDILFIQKTTLPDYFMWIGSSNATLSMYEVHVKTQINKQVYDNEVEEVEWVTLEEMKALIENGEICDNKSILAYYYLLSKQNI